MLADPRIEVEDFLPLLFCRSFNHDFCKSIDFLNVVLLHITSIIFLSCNFQNSPGENSNDGEVILQGVKSETLMYLQLTHF